MALLDRHIAFVEALRAAGLPVSLSEGLDAADAVLALGLSDRELVRAAYAATLVKRQPHRAGFDQVFDLYFPALVGDPVSTTLDQREEDDSDRWSSAQSVAAAPIHIPVRASQAVRAKMDPPLMPAPTAQPPADLAPNPISTAPTR